MAISINLLLLTNPFNLPNRNPKFPKPHHYPPPTLTCSSVTAQSKSAREHLLTLISDQERGLKTQKNPEKRASIVKAIDAMAEFGAGSITTGDSLTGTWRLLWTTEKEQLFIIEKAYLFGTQAGDVLQVIDVQKRTLNNVITFPSDGVFFVRSDIEIASPQRVNFRFTSAVLRGKSWEIPLPPFGQGWLRIWWRSKHVDLILWTTVGWKGGLCIREDGLDQLLSFPNILH